MKMEKSTYTHNREQKKYRMRTLTIRLVGTTPLLLHRVSRHERRDEIAAHAKNGKTLEDEANEVMMKDEKGNPAVPPAWLWEAIHKATPRIIVNERQVSFFKLQSVLCFPDKLLPLQSHNGNCLKWSVYTSVQHAAPNSRRSIAVVAPLFREWALEAQILATNGAFPDNTLLQKIFAEAGKCGIGLFHPPKKQFGQFRALVTHSFADLSRVG